jgi:hypothetical protein
MLNTAPETMPRLPLAGVDRCRYMTKVAGPCLRLRWAFYESSGGQRTTKKQPRPRGLCVLLMVNIASETDHSAPTVGVLVLGL